MRSSFACSGKPSDGATLDNGLLCLNKDLSVDRACVFIPFSTSRDLCGVWAHVGWGVKLWRKWTSSLMVLASKPSCATESGRRPRCRTQLSTAPRYVRTSIRSVCYSTCACVSWNIATGQCKITVKNLNIQCLQPLFVIFLCLQARKYIGHVPSF